MQIAVFGTIPRIGVSIDLMTYQTSCAKLIEGYMRNSGLRFLRGEHEGEYFGVAETGSRRLHVHLKISSSFGDVVVIQANASHFFALADRPWLTHLADAWNGQNRDITAILCPAPHRIGVIARRSRWIREGMPLQEFTSFADRTIAAAVEFFIVLIPPVKLPSTTQSRLRDAN